MPQRIVKDLMRIRHGHVVPDSTPLRVVAERMIVSDCDVMAVTDSDGTLLGVVCESTVVRSLLANAPKSATIAGVVCHHASSVRENACLSQVLPLFRLSANSAIPVVDETSRVVGLLMRRDVISGLIDGEPDTSTEPVNDVIPSANPPAEASEFSIPHRSRNLTAHSNEAARKESTASAGPHFLRSAEARRILWEAEDRL